MEVASTSDVGERDLLESASSEYWERIQMSASGHLNLRPPGASSDFDVNEMDSVTADYMVRGIDQNRSMTGGCVRFRCTKGLSPSQETRTPMLSLWILLCMPRHPLWRHMFLSA